MPRAPGGAAGAAGGYPETGAGQAPRNGVFRRVLREFLCNVVYSEPETGAVHSRIKWSPSAVSSPDQDDCREPMAFERPWGLTDAPPVTQWWQEASRAACSPVNKESLQPPLCRENRSLSAWLPGRGSAREGR